MEAPMRRTRLALLALTLAASIVAVPVLAAQQASVKLNIRAKAEELETDVGIGGRTSRLEHLFETGNLEWPTGTAASQVDRVWSATSTVADGAPDTFDLRGSLTSVLTGDTISFAEVVLLCVQNDSSTATENITIGAGSNPWSTWTAASGDAVVIGPGGIFCISSPVDGWTTTAGTGDILTLTASSGDTIAYDILIVGRSS